MTAKKIESLLISPYEFDKKDWKYQKRLIVALTPEEREKVKWLIRQKES